MGKPGTTQAKRSRELKRQGRQKEKEERRAERKLERLNNPRRQDGEDPDLAGIVPGPQKPLF